VAVAQAAPAARQQNHFLLVFGDLHDLLVGVGQLGNRADGHFQHHVFALGAGAPGGLARRAVGGVYVLAVLEVQQGPELGVAPQDDVAAASAVPAVGTAQRHVLLAAEVH
jgi:hypothetical protein